MLVGTISLQHFLKADLGKRYVTENLVLDFS